MLWVLIRSASPMGLLMSTTTYVFVEKLEQEFRRQHISPKRADKD